MQTEQTLVNTNEIVNEEKKVIPENSNKAKEILQKAKKDAKAKHKAATKKAATKKEDTAKAKNTNLTEINLNQFSSKLSKMDIKEKRAKSKMYIYPDAYLQSKDIDKEKKWRNSMRSKIRTFSNNIFVFAKTKNVESLKKEVAAFVKFYKEFYLVNDFTASSISQSKNDSNFASLEFMMQIVKEVKK